MWTILKFLVSAICCKEFFFPQLTEKSVNRERSFIQPHFVKGRGSIVQLFEWKWSDIASECETFLSLNGYGGVQISPPNENLIISNRPWFERYQPISYFLKTRSGDEQDFLDMTTRCNKVGVRIYVDVVFNHMAADQASRVVIGTGGSLAVPSTRNYSAVPYNVSNFHPPCALVDFNDKYQVRNCELVGLHDLNQTQEDTRGKIVNYLNHLISLGVAGFRVDAAKHQWPQDLKIMYNRLNNLNTSFGFDVNSDPFIYQEVVDSGNEAVSKFEYIFASVSEFRYSYELSRSFRGDDDLKWLKGFGEAWSLLPSKFAVVFIDNHDTQRDSSNGVLSFKNGKNYIMAQAFSLAHPYGIKRIMSSFAFESFDTGPPSKNENIVSPTFDSNGQCNNGWICEHRWNQTTSMVSFMNAVGNESVNSWWDNGKNQIAFSRGSKGFIAFNLDKENMENVSIETSMEPGIYCDVLSGKKDSNNKCSGKTIEISKDGIVFINLPIDDPVGVIAIHINAKISIAN